MGTTHTWLAGLLTATVAATAGAQAAPWPPPFDHHVHLLAPGLLADWARLGVRFSRPDSAYTSVTAALREGGSESAWLVSMAHLYGTGELREALALDLAAERARVERNNDHLAAEVARDTARFTGFCSADPTRPYAAAELARCGALPGMRGIKLHLPSAGIRLEDGAAVSRIAEIVARAGREGRVVLLHAVRLGEVTDSGAARLVRDVLRPARGARVVLAHGGGGGGWSTDSRRVLRALIEARAEDWNGADVRLELSGTALAEEADGVAASTETHRATLARELRAFGLDRVLFGTDYPAFRADRHGRALRDLIPLTDAEWSQVLANRVPR